MKSYAIALAVLLVMTGLVRADYTSATQAKEAALSDHDNAEAAMTFIVDNLSGVLGAYDCFYGMTPDPADETEYNQLMNSVHTKMMAVYNYWYGGQANTDFNDGVNLKTYGDNLYGYYMFGDSEPKHWDACAKFLVVVYAKNVLGTCCDDLNDLADLLGEPHPFP